MSATCSGAFRAPSSAKERTTPNEVGVEFIAIERRLTLGWLSTSLHLIKGIHESGRTELTKGDSSDNRQRSVTYRGAAGILGLELDLPRSLAQIVPLDLALRSAVLCWALERVAKKRKKKKEPRQAKNTPHTFKMSSLIGRCSAPSRSSLLKWSLSRHTITSFSVCSSMTVTEQCSSAQRRWFHVDKTPPPPNKE